MIPVQKQQAPQSFGELVRDKGLALLATNPNPKSNEFRPYWSAIKYPLWEAYRGVCAYYCHWIPRDVGSITVEHFKPKVPYPRDAYEWDNYRLACSLVNSRKGVFEDVLDPFEIQAGWFWMEFPSMMVMPGENITADIKTKVVATIKRLKLNDDEECVRARFDWLQAYCDEEFTFAYLEKKAPFIAYELNRQNLMRVPVIKSLFTVPKSTSFPG